VFALDQDCHEAAQTAARAKREQAQAAKKEKQTDAQ